MTEVIKQAATLILIRNKQENQGLEVYMTKRPKTMSFLPEYYVFPGGVMQQEDRDETIFPHCKHFHLVNFHLISHTSYAITAIRECFEEVGYLLADVNGQIAHHQADLIHIIRQQLLAGSLSFHKWVRSQPICLRTDLLRYYGHRITPRVMSMRRFDTRYFLTIVPREIELTPCVKEVEHANWLDPKEALQHVKSGTMKMVLPTIDALLDLSQYHTAKDAFQFGKGVGTPRPHELA